MVAEAPAALDPRRVAPATLRRAPASRTQIEMVVTRAVALFAALLGLQTVPTVLSRLDGTDPVWNAVLIPLLYACIIALGVGSLVRHFARIFAGAFAIVYVVALQTWLLAVHEPGLAAQWIYALMPVAVACAAIGFNTVIATTYLIVEPIIYGFWRLLPSGGSATWAMSVLDAADIIIFGGIVIVIITMLRYAAGSVDDAQSTALDRYALAVRQHATEVERVQVDSIVHDSVLTTLLSAARAETPEAKALAASMAANAIGHLRDAALLAPDDASTMSHAALARRITEAAHTIGAGFEVRSRPLPARAVPALAADVLYSAVVQAMMNSLQHAGGPDVRRWVTVRSSPSMGLVVEVGDVGKGFDPGVIPAERLGLRVSIIERMASAGGRATVDSAVGEGTVITVEWPDPEPGEHAEADA